MAYVYQHVRLDTNEPFYIGIGSDDKNYQRANNKFNRSLWWKRIHSKVETKVEILKDNLTWEEAIEFEKFYIKIFGRKNIGTGILVNLTDGGDGTVGALVSEETKEKIRIKSLGRSGFGKKKILQFDKEGNLIKEWDCLYFTRIEGFNFRKIQDILHSRSRSRFHKDFRWEFKEVWNNYSEEQQFEIIEKAKEPNKTTKGRRLVLEYKEKKNYYKKVENPIDLRKKIEQYDLEGVLIKEYPSIISTKEAGFNPKKISECLSGRNKTHKSFIWKYKL